jgi:hypothetical protein
MAHELEPWVSMQMFKILFGAGEEVVDPKYLMAIFEKAIN